jgi:hypothetical protein
MGVCRRVCDLIEVMNWNERLGVECFEETFYANKYLNR